MRASFRFLFTQRRFVDNLQRLDDPYRLFRSQRNWKQAILVQIHHAQIQSFTGIFTSLEKDTEGSSNILWAGIVNMAYRYKQLSGMGSDLATTAELLLDVVKAFLTTCESATQAEFLVLEAELSGC
ncbi:hypothetical protein B0I35DRAFT_483047 [Stachybotrys elegans]|uniref:Uncharacterized protein n=1 Tax=Stachybotrys elegans TaxID=80388 RepID=A0A8K0SG90_9HYPO|nr:hypothetical protein B0I35DRAFT_483047 [Stachybotrys elegans]